MLGLPLPQGLSSPLSADACTYLLLTEKGEDLTHCQLLIPTCAMDVPGSPTLSIPSLRHTEGQGRDCGEASEALIWGTAFKGTKKYSNQKQSYLNAKLYLKIHFHAKVHNEQNIRT